MLKEREIPYTYREYRKEPLSADELRDVLRKLGLPASAVLRRNDKANAELGLTGDEPEDELIAHMATHPTLLQRPIGVVGDRAVVGRPAERLLELPREG
ncbi:MAG: arsenate reductase (glutaredoxin) [Alphaproteobacteria bacterium]|nr:arsenate reductase (glutaredoxin) [Myxococcales bacterium]MCB9687840.1 arsenate reductase (glutaredoxin) [Alphaproteobacteria bacterium]MCB9698886.1 arsenate reductase (glutaredoxin) [Alphaproteobacteria bacterium]